MQRVRYSMKTGQIYLNLPQQSQSRRAACTHVCASRVFDEHILCSHCERPGNMGWVYRCTQDSDGRLPIDESGLDESEQLSLKENASRDGWRLPGVDPAFAERMFKAESDHEDISILKPWMRNAAASGEYSSAQIEKLIAQRLEVREAIRAKEISVIWTDEMLYLPQGGETEQADNNTRENATGLDGQQTETSKSSACDYRCCAACRPVMRDRAWLAMDSIVHPEDPDIFPNDFDFRPMASAKIILGIGSHQYNTQSTTSTSITELESSEELYIPEFPGPIKRRRSVSFIDNIRHMYEAFVVKPIRRSKSTGSRSTHSPAPSFLSDQEMDIVDAAEDERMVTLSVARPESRMGEYSLLEAFGNGGISRLPTGLLQHMPRESIDNLIASAASHSTLPIQGNHSHGELHIGAGVAVTEEAVGLGMADIITQA